MNRLEAIHHLRDHHKVFDNGDGTYTVIYHYSKEVADDIGEQPGIYSYISTQRNPPNVNFSDLTKMSVVEVANLYRHAYPRRTPGQCAFKYGDDAYVVEGKAYVCRCTTIHEHDHCKKCEAVCYGSLCTTCKEQSDKARAEITKALANYVNTYNIPFRKDDEVYDAMVGVDEYGGQTVPYRGDREDFHSDG